MFSKDQNIKYNQKPMFGFIVFVIIEFKTVKLAFLSMRHDFNVTWHDFILDKLLFGLWKHFTIRKCYTQHFVDANKLKL